MKPKRYTKRHGFTLIELIVVLAIVAIIAAIAVPTAFGALESARNTTDAYNAKVYGQTISYYFASHPEQMQELIDICAAGGSNHCIQMSVGPDNSSIHKLLSAALADAGLVKTVGATRYTEITCQSKKTWQGYYVVVNADEDGIHVRYFGFPVGTTFTHKTHSWGYYSTTTDPTGFYTAVTGAA